MFHTVLASCIAGYAEKVFEAFNTLPQYSSYPFYKTSMAPHLGVDQTYV